MPRGVAFAISVVTVIGVARALVERKRGQRRDEFINQLPDVARVLSNGTSAGLSMAGAMELAARELAQPAATEMGVVVQETRLGMPLEASLERLRDRLPSREVAVLMTTLIIQQRAGGDTVRALSELGQTLEARKDLLREIRTMLSGAVFTSYLVAGMGAGTILMINAISPGIMRQLTTTLRRVARAHRVRDALRHRVRADQADHEGGDVTPGLAGLLAAVAVGIGLAGIPMLRDRGPEERLGLRIDSDSGRRVPLLRRIFERVASFMGPRVVPAIRASRRESVDRRLDLAGRPGGVTVQRFYGYKAAGLILLGGPFALLLAGGGSPAAVILAAGIGWFFPDMWISRAGRVRQERIERELPDFLDILAVTVRAGLGYRLALSRVADALEGPVGEEMMIALRQMELGASRRAAFEALRDRNGSEQLQSFVAAQLQAEELGVPLSEALNDIAADMRRAAHQAARRRAARATPRVSLIVTSLILPGTMILIAVSILLGSGLQDSGLFQ